MKVGYKWYDAEKKPVLFPFGYGLSYTSYRYSGLSLASENKVKVTFTVANTGARAGAEIAEVYAALPASAEEPPKRLVGWSKVKLEPGEKRTVTVEIEPKYLSIFDEAKDAWTLRPRRIQIPCGRQFARSSAQGDGELEIRILAKLLQAMGCVRRLCQGTTSVAP